jgi:hypothetical protein
VDQRRQEGRRVSGQSQNTDRILTQAEAMQAIPTLRVSDRETPGDDFVGRVDPQIIHRTGDDQICRRMMKLRTINILSPSIILRMLEWHSVDAILTHQGMAQCESWESETPLIADAAIKFTCPLISPRIRSRKPFCR